VRRAIKLRQHRINGMRREDANIAQARERERRYLTSIENHPGSRGGSMIYSLLYRG
jgi:hypothetical protein